MVSKHCPNITTLSDFKSETMLSSLTFNSKQLTLGIATVTAWQILVALKLKLLFGDYADAQNKIADSLINKTTMMLDMYCCELSSSF